MTRVCTALLLALTAADIATTLIGLSRGAHESAPLASAALAWGVPGLLMMSAVGLLAELAILRIMPRVFRPAGWLLVLSISCYPVASNLALLLG